MNKKLYSLAEEIHPAITSTRATVLDCLACRCFIEESREALDILASHLRLIRLLYKSDCYILAIYGDNAILREGFKLGFYSFAVRTPISIVHRERCNRGRASITKASNKALYASLRNDAKHG